MDNFFFSIAFRPLFLLAALYAPVSLLIWLLQLYGAFGFDFGIYNPLFWHSHELIYGFTAAGIGGFVFTAVANWTGRKPLGGAPLIALCLLWLLGRVAMLSGSWLNPLVVMLMDVSFLVLMAFFLWRELYAGKNARNYVVLALVCLLLTFNIVFHLEMLGIITHGQWGIRGAILTVILLVSLIGGRIIPAFTRNWLVQNRPDGGLPVQTNRFDFAVLLFTVISLLLWALFPAHVVTGIFLVVTGVMHGVRLSRWRGLATVSEPLLFILHVAYFWIAPGFILMGIAVLVQIPTSAGIHALTTGTITTMIIAVAARAGRGHSGRELKSDVMLNLVFILFTTATLVRVVASLTGSVFQIQISGALWVVAFMLYIVAMAPILLKPALTDSP